MAQYSQPGQGLGEKTRKEKEKQLPPIETKLSLELRKVGFSQGFKTSGPSKLYFKT